MHATARSVFFCSSLNVAYRQVFSDTPALFISTSPSQHFVAALHSAVAEACRGPPQAGCSSKIILSCCASLPVAATESGREVEGVPTTMFCDWKNTDHVVADVRGCCQSPRQCT